MPLQAQTPTITPTLPTNAELKAAGVTFNATTNTFDLGGQFFKGNFSNSFTFTIRASNLESNVSANLSAENGIGSSPGDFLISSPDAAGDIELVRNLNFSAPHVQAGVTITVTFNPLTAGAKVAILNVRGGALMGSNVVNVANPPGPYILNGEGLTPEAAGISSSLEVTFPSDGDLSTNGVTRGTGDDVNEFTFEESFLQTENRLLHTPGDILNSFNFDLSGVALTQNVVLTLSGANANDFSLSTKIKTVTQHNHAIPTSVLTLAEANVDALQDDRTPTEQRSLYPIRVHFNHTPQTQS